MGIGGDAEPDARFGGELKELEGGVLLLAGLGANPLVLSLDGASRGRDRLRGAGS